MKEIIYQYINVSILIFLFSIILPATLAAQTYDLSLVADENTMIPGGIGNFTSFNDPVSLGGGDVAFRATGSGGQSGIYVFSGGMLIVAVDENDMIPGGVGNFTTINDPTSIGGGDFVFRGLGSGGQSGLYIYSGGMLTLVADENTAIPGGGGNFTTFSNTAALINIGDFVFNGQGAAQDGLYTYISGTLGVAANNGTAIPGGAGNFTDYADPYPLDPGNFAFGGFGAGQEGLYRSVSGTIGLIADLNTLIPPGGLGNFTDFAPPIIASLGGNNLAFKALGAGVEGIYTFISGTLAVVADTNTAVPDGMGNFTDFNSAVSIDDGNLAFRGFSAAGQGIYSSIGGSLDVVVDVNTPMPGAGENFVQVNPPVSLGFGDMTFQGFGMVVFGIYSSVSGNIAMVVDTNTAIPSGVGNFTGFDDPVSLGGGDIVFEGFGTSSQSGLYIAELQTGSLTIVKESDPDGVMGFEFNGTGFPMDCALDGTFTLDDDQFIACDLIPGDYTVEETNAQGLTLTNIDCVGDSAFTTTATSVTVTMGFDDVTVCTFTNQELYSLNVNILGTGGGTVTSAPAGIDCPGDCAEDYLTGTMVTLTAAPDAFSVFEGWGGDCAGVDHMTSVTVDSNKTCTATFTLIEYKLTVLKIGTGDGVVTSAPTGIDCGADCNEEYVVNTKVILTPTADPGSHFEEWTGDPDCSDGMVTMTMDITCVAAFELNAGPPDTADLSIMKIDDPDPVEINSELTYTLLVENKGPDTASRVIITDVLPEEVTFVSASAPESCSLDNGLVICNLGRILSGRQASAEIIVIPNQVGTISNTATVNSAVHDPRRFDNTTTITTEVVAPDEEFLTVVPDPVQVTTVPGSMVSFSVDINNPDTVQAASQLLTRQTATGVVFGVDLPGGFTLDGLSASQGTCDVEMQECAIGDILPTQTVRIAVNLIAPGVDGTFDIDFFARTLSALTFNGKSIVVVEGNDSAGAGSCSIAPVDASGADLLGLLMPLMLLPLLVMLRRKISPYQ